MLSGTLELFWQVLTKRLLGVWQRLHCSNTCLKSTADYINQEQFIDIFSIFQYSYLDFLMGTYEFLIKLVFKTFCFCSCCCGWRVFLPPLYFLSSYCWYLKKLFPFFFLYKVQWTRYFSDLLMFLLVFHWGSWVFQAQNKIIRLPLPYQCLYLLCHTFISLHCNIK